MPQDAGFPPDDKRRHQFVPVDEAPPLYPDEATGSANRFRTGDDNPDPDDEDADAIHHRASHRAASEDSADLQLEQLEIEEPPVAEPLVLRTYRKFHHSVQRVDVALNRYVNSTVLQYVYGAILGTAVLALIYVFGGSIPRIKAPKRFKEESLREYIKKQVSAENIGNYIAKMEPLQGVSPFVAEPQALARWVQDELATFKMGRTALVDHYVLQATGPQSWTFLERKHDVPEAALIAHGASGNATGPLIFANTAQPEDFAFLASQNIRLEGSIALVCRNRSELLSIQAARIAQSGAIGAMVYDARHSNEPSENPWIIDSIAEGGDVAQSWVQPGDPLTPGVAADRPVKTLDRDSAPGLLKIPVLAIAAGEADTILKSIQEHGAKTSTAWQATSPLLPLWTGNSTSPQMTLDSQLKQNPKTPIYSALSEIDGMESEQTLVVGTSMEIANAAVLLEVARVFASLNAQHSWMPRRNLVFAFWAGSQTNFLGSTEWVESQTKSLRFTGIAYLNLDHVLSTSAELDVAAHRALHSAILTAASHTDNETIELREPTQFSDAISFSARAGMPSAELRFKETPISQACKRSAQCIDSVDPNHANQARLAKLLALLILEFVDEVFIPVDVRQTVAAVEDAAQRMAHSSELSVDQSLAKVFQILEERTNTFNQFKSDWDLALTEQSMLESPAAAIGRGNWNYAVVAFQRALIRNARWTVWFENSLYGPSAKLERQGESWALPRVQDALSDGDVAKAQGLLQMVGELLLEAAKALEF